MKKVLLGLTAALITAGIFTAATAVRENASAVSLAKPVKCPQCNGKGGVDDTCWTCSGVGKVSNNDAKKPKMVKCSTCKGKGKAKVICNLCNGAGKYDPAKLGK